MFGTLNGIFLTSTGSGIGADSALQGPGMPAPTWADMESQSTIENGTVGGRLHLLTVPPEGAIEEEPIDPELHVRGLPLDPWELL